VAVSPSLAFPPRCASPPHLAAPPLSPCTRAHMPQPELRRALLNERRWACVNAFLAMANANSWALLAATVDDPKPQRPSKKQPAAASLDASAGQGVPPAPINRAAAAAFPSPSPSSSKSGDFPALPGNPPPPSHTRVQSAAAASALGGSAPVAAASQHASPGQGAMPTVGQAASSSQSKSAPATHPKAAPNKADWGYLSSERQKDKARSLQAGLLFGSKSSRSGTQHGGAFEERVRGIGATEQGSVSAIYL
jgi:hypothetical protein